MLNRIKLLAIFGIFLSGNALAGPADYLYYPVVTKGEREIDFKFGTSKSQSGERTTVSKLGYGFTPTDYWFTEIYAKHEKEGSDKQPQIEWENRFQFTETGKYRFEVGMIQELEFPVEKNHPYQLKLGPLLQTSIDAFQINGNLLFKRKFGPASDNAVTEMGYQFQTKYRYKKEFEFGIQGFGEVGEWDNWKQSNLQNHRWGPAVFGKIGLNNLTKIKYNAAILYGVSSAAPDHTYRMQLEYEF